MKKVWALSMAGVMTLGIAGCNAEEGAAGGEAAASAGESVTLTLSTPDPDNASVTVAAKELAEIVAEKSDGAIEIEVHPNGSLYGGDPAAAIKQLGAGGLDMLVLSTSAYANFEPRFNAISVPYLFDDKDQFVSFLNGDIGTELLDSVSELDIEGLGYWTRDFRQITNSVRPITQPADLEGIKLRVPNNPLWVEFFKEAGAVTTPMDFSEVYNALQLGTIDGQENPLTVIAAANMYEVQDYLTISNHMADGWLVGINEANFSELTEEQQAILEESVEEVQTWAINYDNEQAQVAIDQAEEAGVEVNELTSEQQQEFVEVSQEAYPAFKELVQDDEFFTSVLEFVGKAE